MNVLEFNSDRKRMSVIIRDSNEKLILLCKGADSIIKERLDKKYTSTENSLVEKSPESKLLEATDEAIDRWAETGLRTLMLASKQITTDYYKQWSAKVKQ